MTNENHFDLENAKQLHPLLEKFLSSYGEQAQDPAWLVNALQNEHPEKTPEEIQNLAQGIRDSVDIWNDNMASLNQACAEGTSKENWLAGRLQEAAAETPVNEYGADLTKLGTALHAANNSAIAEIEGFPSPNSPSSTATPVPEGSIPAEEWTPDQAHSAAAHIGKEVDVHNLAGMVLQNGWKFVDALPEKAGFQGIKQVADALRSGDDHGVKEAATAALQTGIERGYVPLLPKTTPISVVSGVACYGVEQAKIMLQYAEGDISGQKALELSGRTAIAVIAHPLTKKFEAIGARLGQKAGMAVGAMVSTVLPVLAPVATAVGGFIGGVVGKVAGSAIGQTIRKGAEKIVEVAKPVLKAAWEGVKNVGRSIVSGVKNFFESIFG